MRALLILCGVVGLAAGCASTGAATAGEDGVVYGADADSNLKKGDESLESKNYPEAQHYFEFVKTKYPFLEAAKIAELRLADTDFERERYVEARDRYQSFIRLHPGHAQVDYAAFRAALTHYRDVPSDFFLLPPAEEKDQVEVRNALIAMEDFIRGYPESKHKVEAAKVILEAKRKLAQHELYVARFYAKRERWPAVVARLGAVGKKYSGAGFDEEVAFGLYDAYQRMKDEVRARDALRSYVASFPGDPGADKARKLLGAEVTPVVAPPGTPDAGT